MKHILKTLVVLTALTTTIASCKKLALQKDYDYNASVYSSQVNQTLWDFMNTRSDLFSSLMNALNYVDPNATGIKKTYMTPQSGTTFLLLTNSALTDITNTNSYWYKNLRYSTDSAKWVLHGSDWSQYNKDTITEVLKYHVIKGDYSLKNVGGVPIWVPTYALSATNDSAYINLQLTPDRNAYFYINAYTGSPTGNTKARTPDLHLNGGVIVHVMDTYMQEPPKSAVHN